MEVEGRLVSVGGVVGVTNNPRLVALEQNVEE